MNCIRTKWNAQRAKERATQRLREAMNDSTAMVCYKGRYRQTDSQTGKH